MRSCRGNLIKFRTGFHHCHQRAVTLSWIIRRAEGFTLHGLWPNLDNPCPADYPEHCDDSVFNRNEIDDDVLQSMNRTWPSYSTCEPSEHLKSSCPKHD